MAHNPNQHLKCVETICSPQGQTDDAFVRGRKNSFGEIHKETWPLQMKYLLALIQHMICVFNMTWKITLAFAN